MSNHSVIEHRANYYFLKIEEDYLHICKGDHCKASILSILEQWMNDKRSKGKDLYVYMTYPQWIESMYGLYGRSYIMDRLAELEEEGLITKRPYRLYGRIDTFEYLLIASAVQEKLRLLPEKSPKDTRPNLDAFKNKRVQKQTRSKLDGSPVQNKTRHPSKNGRNIESITQNTDTIDYVEESTDASAIAPAALTPFSQQVETSSTDSYSHNEPQAREKAEQDGQDTQRDHADAGQENVVGQALSGRADAVPADAQKTPPKPRRTPPVLKEGVPSNEQIENVFICLEQTIRRLTEQEDFTYSRTKAAKAAVKEWLTGRPEASQKKLSWHVTTLYHKPKDSKSDFYWREHLSVAAILNNYDREIVNYRNGAVPASTTRTKPQLPPRMPSRAELLLEEV